MMKKVFAVSILTILAVSAANAKIVSQENIVGTGSVTVSLPTTGTNAGKVVVNSPSLATVATSGSYNDLSNKPTIPAAQVNADWNATTGVAQILNKPTLAAVATSGNASDLTTDATHRLVTDTEKSTWNAKQATLTFDDAPTANSSNPVKSGGVKTALDAKQNAITSSNKLSYDLISGTPTIPTVNDATLTIQKNGTNVATFTANSGTAATANITVPTKVSELTNDSGYLTSHNPIDSALSDTSTNAVQNKIVNTALANKQDKTSMVTATTGTDYTGNKESTTMYPSMATVGQMITDGTNGIATTAASKQPLSTANYQMGKSGGGWTTMSTQQQNMLNGKVPVGAESGSSVTGYAAIWVE